MDGISDFLQTLLSLTAWTGPVTSVISVISIIFIIIREIMSSMSSISGWVSMVSVTLFLGGIQLLCTGTAGEYIDRTYLQIKHRLVYIVKERK